MATTHEHQLDTTDGPMRLYEAVPDGQAEGALIVVMEAFGVNDHIEDVCRRAAAEGFHTVAPDFFHRAGGGTASYDDFGKVMELFAGVGVDSVLVDIDATLAHLQEAGFSVGDVAVTGFCWGGWAAFLAAARRPLRAGVTWYGGGIVEPGGLGMDTLIDDAASMQSPWLGLFGDLDASIPVEQVEALRTATRDAAVATDVVRYADVDHGFHCDARPMYDENAATDGWARMLAWIRR